MSMKEAKLLDGFLSLLTEATGFSVESIGDGEVDCQLGFDALVKLDTPDGMPPIELAVKLSGRELYPRDVMLEKLRLEQVKQHYPRNIEVCLVAQALSPSARELLKAADINFFDTSGTLYFKARPWLIDIERLSKRAATKKPLTVFAGAREQVVHALLYHHLRLGPKAYISGVELAQLSQSSGYTVTQTMRELERLDLVETTGSGPKQQRRAKDTGRLLDVWAEERSKKKPVVSLWYLASPNAPLLTNLLARIDALALEDALVTGAAAANMLTPTITSVPTVELIVSEGATADVAKALDLKMAARGHNIQIFERHGAAQLFPTEDPYTGHPHFASPFTLYLDLLNGVGRNKELASAFRQDTLRM